MTEDLREKKVKKSAKAKKSKKKKEEIEAEERRIAIEQEKLRVREEAQKAAKKEKECIVSHLVKDKQAELRKEERDRLESEFIELHTAIQGKSTELIKAQKVIRDEEDWKVHVTCNTYEGQVINIEQRINEILTTISLENLSSEDLVQLCDLIMVQAADIDDTLEKESLDNLVPKLREKVTSILTAATLKIQDSLAFNEGAYNECFVGKTNHVRMYVAAFKHKIDEAMTVRFEDSTEFDLPKALSNDGMIIRFCTFAPGFYCQVKEQDNWDFFVMGRTYDVDVFSLPRLLASAQNTNLPEVSRKLKRLPLPQVDALSIRLSKPKELRLQPRCFISFFDELTNSWSMIEDTNSEAGDTCDVTVKIRKHGFFSFLQRSGLQWKGWSICPSLKIGASHLPRRNARKNMPVAVYTLETAIHTVTLEVCNNLCRLVQPDSKELDLLHWMPPRKMLNALRNKGLDLLSNTTCCEGQNEPTIGSKFTDLEKQAYIDCGWLVSSGLLCCSSNRSQTRHLTNNLITFDVYENPELYGGSLNMLWTAVLERFSYSENETGAQTEIDRVSKPEVRYRLLRGIGENSQEDEKGRKQEQDTRSHAHLTRCFQEVLPPDFYTRVVKNNVLLGHTITEILTLTRPLRSGFAGKI